jgi:peroxiredoxin
MPAERCGMSAAGPPRYVPAAQLSPGAAAPEFSALLLSGGEFGAAALRQGRVWLTFFHFLDCPLCLLRAHEMIRRYPHWAAPDFQMVAVFHATPERVRQSLPRHGAPPFPVLCDPELKLYARFGLRPAGPGAVHNLGYRLRALGAILRGCPPARSHRDAVVFPGDFLIGDGGRLHAVHYGAQMGDHIRFDIVEQWLGFKLVK